MSIIIEGMEMPEYCHRAEIGIDADGNGMLFVYEPDATEPEIYSLKKTGNHWISVKDKMPEDNYQKIVFHNRGVSFAHYDGNNWISSIGKRHYLKTVTHWMPLPMPPVDCESEKNVCDTKYHAKARYLQKCFDT